MPAIPALPHLAAPVLAAPVVALSAVAQSIQLSLSPVFVLAGIAALLNLLASRLSRVVDRVRALEPLHGAADGPGRERLVRELRVLDRRITVINWALTLATLSAVTVCALVATMFVASLARLHAGREVALLFIAAMALLGLSLAAFLAEVRLSLAAIRVRRELLR